MKPNLILHPGFPKCATSTIQSLFVKERHAIAKSLGLSFIGEDFKPNNGYPSVSKLMYDYDSCVADIVENDYPSANYFMSNEALKMHPEFISVLKSRFHIIRTICTVRFPVTQSISHFRYSGWLTDTFANFVKPKSNYSIYSIGAKYSSKYLGDLAKSTYFVPVEGRQSNRFEERFCLTAFEQVPHLLNEPPFNNLPRINVAPPLGFAEMLAHEIKRRGIKILGSDRQRVVLAAKNHSLPEELRNLGGAQMALLSPEKVADCLKEYQDFLLVQGCGANVAIDARKKAEKDYAQLSKELVATPAQSRALQREAELLLDSVLETF